MTETGPWLSCRTEARWPGEVLLEVARHPPQALSLGAPLGPLAIEGHQLALEPPEFGQRSGRSLGRVEQLLGGRNLGAVEGRQHDVPVDRLGVVRGVERGVVEAVEGARQWSCGAMD